MTTVGEYIKGNPKEALGELLDTTLPDNLEVQVLQDTETIKHVVLPTASLTSHEMAEVSGGKGPTNLVRLLIEDHFVPGAGSVLDRTPTSSILRNSFSSIGSAGSEVAASTAKTGASKLAVLGVGTVGVTAGAGGVMAYQHRDEICNWLNKGI